MKNLPALLSALRTAIIKHMPMGNVKAWAVKNIQPKDLAKLAIAGLKAKAKGHMQSSGNASNMALQYSIARDEQNGKDGFWQRVTSGTGFSGGEFVSALEGDLRKQGRGEFASKLGWTGSHLVAWERSAAGFKNYVTMAFPWADGSFNMVVIPNDLIPDGKIQAGKLHDLSISTLVSMPSCLLRLNAEKIAIAAKINKKTRWFLHLVPENPLFPPPPIFLGT